MKKIFCLFFIFSTIFIFPVPSQATTTILANLEKPAITSIQIIESNDGGTQELPLEGLEKVFLLDTESIYVNGEKWSFKTKAPSEKNIIPTHPRLMLTQETISGIATKLSDPVYTADIASLESKADGGDYLSGAFLYAVFNDTTRGAAAKTILLRGNYGSYSGYDVAAEWAVPILVFDWIYPLLSTAEKTQVFNLLKANIDFDHDVDPEPEISWYWNDEWARHKPLHYPALALAIYNDGIDDVWADEVIDLAYGDSTYALGPYSTDTLSGFLDVLMTLSMDDGGGEQSGHNTQLGDGYYNFFLHSMFPLAMWESATGQEMWSRTPYYQKLPSYWAYTNHSSPTSLGLATLEYITGLYKTIDADEAALAKWMLDKHGRSNYHLVFRLLHGDLRVTAKSPETLALPTTQYIKGADLFTSRTSWDDSDSVVLSVYSRYLDTSRYEPYSGVYGIYKNGSPLLARGGGLKTKPTSGTYSGLWIYDPANGDMGQGSTYWAGFGNYVWTDRAYNAFSAASEALYFPVGPDKWEHTPDYRAITQEYSRLLTASPVDTARTTIIHIPDGEREFVIVYDYAKIGNNLKAATSMRLVETPQINGNSFSINGMNVTVISPENSQLGWVGGLNNEYLTPAPELAWYGNSNGGYVPGYSASAEMTNIAGLGNLYIYPTETSDDYEFLSVIEISDLTPLTVTKISDSSVTFGQWEVLFFPNGLYAVNKTAP